MKKTANRREFLIQSGHWLAASSLVGCSHLDSWMFQRSSEDEARVPVVGGGLAGLSAAYALKKAGRPFRVFEASGQWGGRVQGLQSFGKAGFPVDLGGEWIRSDQEQLLNLIKELRLKTLGQEKLSEFFLPPGAGRPQEWPDVSQLEKELRRFALQNTRSQVDETPFAELQDRVRKSVSSNAFEWFRAWADFEWGADAEDISSLQVLTQFMNLAKPQQKQNSKYYLRIEGGARVLVQTLLDRLMGVIPNQFCRLEHRLVRVRQKEGLFQLTFLNTATGDEEDVRCRSWICALPPTQWIKVEGLVSFLPESLQSLSPQLRMASQTKIALETESNLPSGLRFWDPSFGQALAQGPGQGPGGQAQRHVKLAGLWQWQGQSSSEASTLDRVRPRILQLSQSSSRLLSQEILQKNFRYQDVSILNWAEVNSIGGSKTCLAPGGWSAFSEAVATLPSENLVLASEALSVRWMGTMAGAVESGLQAAQSLLNRVTGLHQGFLNSRFKS